MKVRKLKTRIAAFGLAVLMGISTLSSANAFAAEQTGSEQQTEVQASEQAVTSQRLFHTLHLLPASSWMPLIFSIKNKMSNWTSRLLFILFLLCF